MATPGGRKKSRIVIDVGRAQAEAEARRRRGLRGRLPPRVGALPAAALVALVLLLALLAGGYAWWSSYRKRPAYSLALLVDAARRDDLREVEALIDSDQVAQNFVPQVTEKLTGATAPAGGPQRQQIAAALPALLPRVRETVRDEVARGVKGLAERVGGDVPFPVLALGVWRAAEVREEGDAATVALDAGDRPVEVGMRREGDRWKVVSVRDDALAAGLAQRIAGSLPPPPPPPRQRGGR